jgi:hypothetical protein
LQAFLDGTWTASDRRAELAAFPTPRYERMIEVYRDHIPDHCPPA